MTTAARQWVYFFGAGSADGGSELRNLLGGKGANVAEMARLGIPVPPGFTLTTDVCNHFMLHNGAYPEGLSESVEAGLERLQSITGKRFGDADNPLLVSVRSGAKISMPGMMDTVLNLGLNDVTVEGLAAQSGNPRFAWDCYRRFVQMFGDVVLGMKPQNSQERDPFELLLEAKKHERGVMLDSELAVDDLKALVATFKSE